MEIMINILKLNVNNYITLQAQELNEVLKNFSVFYEEDTILSGKIRILKKDESYFIQETTSKQEILIRRMKNTFEAEELVKQRLEIYDKMWDGCGCKVDYYS